MLGANGAGKSTLIKLLLSHYKVDEGTITINGCYDINNINSIKIGYMAQNDPHFSLTLKENVIFGTVYEKERFMETIQKAGIINLIESLPLKEDTLLGMAYGEGREISGGQWQRINFARLLYNRCDIVILDEPTASMDPLAERNLYCEIKELFKDKIVIIVSHRLSSVGIADKIIFLEDGEVTGFDTHEALLKSCTSYKSMIAVQEKLSEGGSY
jgi:ATP-binding cassette subfamily B protein